MPRLPLITTCIVHSGLCVSAPTCTAFECWLDELSYQRRTLVIHLMLRNSLAKRQPVPNHNCNNPPNRWSRQRGAKIWLRRSSTSLPKSTSSPFGRRKALPKQLSAKLRKQSHSPTMEDKQTSSRTKSRKCLAFSNQIDRAFRDDHARHSDPEVLQGAGYERRSLQNPFHPCTKCLDRR